LPRAEARGDQPGGELEAGLDADFEGEVVGVFELVVADDRHEGAQHLESTIEIQPRLHGVRQSDLGIPPELKGAAAVVALDVECVDVVIIDIQLLPDGSNTATDKGAVFYLPRLTENSIDLNRDLHQLTIGRVM